MEHKLARFLSEHKMHRVIINYVQILAGESDDFEYNNHRYINFWDHSIPTTFTEKANTFKKLFSISQYYNIFVVFEHLMNFKC